jgi:hypothetical protein
MRHFAGQQPPAATLPPPRYEPVVAYSRCFAGLTTPSAGASPQDSPSTPGPIDHMVLAADGWVVLDTAAGTRDDAADMLDARAAANAATGGAGVGSDGLGNDMMLDDDESAEAAHGATTLQTETADDSCAPSQPKQQQEQPEVRPPGPPLTLQLPPYSFADPGPSTQELVTSPSWMTMSHPLSDHCPGATNITLLEVPDEEEEGEWGEVAQGRLESVMSTPVNLMQRLPSFTTHHSQSTPSSLKHRAYSLPVPLGWQQFPQSFASVESSGSLKQPLPAELHCPLASPSTSGAASAEGQKGPAGIVPATPAAGGPLESPGSNGTAAAGGRRSARAVKGVTNFAVLHSGDIRGLAAQQHQQRQAARAKAAQQQTAGGATEGGSSNGDSNAAGGSASASAAQLQVAASVDNAAGAMQSWQLGSLGSGAVPSVLWAGGPGDWQVQASSMQIATPGMTSCASGTDMAAMGMGMGGVLVQGVPEVPSMPTPAPTPSQMLVPPPRTVNGTTSRKKRSLGSTTARPSSGVPAGHSCASCGTQVTPVWRAGPAGPKSLCNACSLRWRKVTKGH